MSTPLNDEPQLKEPITRTDVIDHLDDPQMLSNIPMPLVL